MEHPARPDSTLYCSFCGKSQHEVVKLIAGPTVFICDECVLLSLDIVCEELNINTLKRLATGYQDIFKMRSWLQVKDLPGLPFLNECLGTKLSEHFVEKVGTIQEVLEKLFRRALTLIEDKQSRIELEAEALQINAEIEVLNGQHLEMIANLERRRLEIQMRMSTKDLRR